MERKMKRMKEGWKGGIVRHREEGRKERSNHRC
jgi:hypothetical protein